jgi:hypothetical protein
MRKQRKVSGSRQSLSAWLFRACMQMTSSLAHNVARWLAGTPALPAVSLFQQGTTFTSMRCAGQGKHTPQRLRCELA